MRPESLVGQSRASSRRLHAFDAFRAAGAQNDFLQPAFRRFQLFVAMGLQRLSAFIERDGIFQIHLALLQARDNAFQLLESRLETEALNSGRLARGSLRRNDGAPAVLDVSVNPKLRCTIIAIMESPCQLRAPAPPTYRSRTWGNKEFTRVTFRVFPSGLGNWVAFS